MAERAVQAIEFALEGDLRDYETVTFDVNAGPAA
jgi:hypothetical protein